MSLSVESVSLVIETSGGFIGEIFGGGGFLNGFLKSVSVL